jgi:hypothetical protein
MGYLYSMESTPSEILVKAMEVIEGATHVIVIVSAPNKISVRSNCDHKELHFLLSQSQYSTMKDIFEE